jgi:hypothetical protein
LILTEKKFFVYELRKIDVVNFGLFLLSSKSVEFSLDEDFKFELQGGFILNYFPGSEV